MRIETLSNGLRVVLVPCEAESVAVGLFIASGSRHETEKTAGISHFIEHMLFKGTPTRSPLDITQAIEGRGGNFNACTGEESTCYYAHLPSEYLAEAVDILTDMYLNATIPADEFAREKQVVIEEIKMYVDEPDAVAMENLQRNLFPGCRLGAPVAGSASSLGPLKPTDLKRYVKSHYRADNTVVVIAGDFNEERAIAEVKKRIAKLRKAKVSAAVSHDGAPFAKPVVREQSVCKDINQAQLALGFRAFGIDHPLKYAATVLDSILGRGMMSRLFQEVREKRGLSYDISSRMLSFRDAGMFTVTGGMDASKRDLALRTVDREIARICKSKVGAAELKRCKDFIIGNFRLSHEKVVSKLFYHGAALLSFGRIMPTSEQVESIAKVTADDIRLAAQTIFQPSNRSVSWVLPR